MTIITHVELDKDATTDKVSSDKGQEFAKPDESRVDPANLKSETKSVDEANSNTKTEEDTWGYDLYPERKGSKPGAKWWEIAFLGEGRDNIDKVKCERNIYKCAKNSPLVKLMMSALKSSGCDVDLRRHITCEVCDKSVTGGYDPVLNQVVVCQNRARSESMVQGVLAHEMIHMFDFCRHNLDFRNVQHLACTEIRAANLTHCSFLSAWVQGDASPFNIKQAHQECVKSKAIASVVAVRRISTEEARKVVDEVFPQCYADLEPVGRRIRRNSPDMHRAYNERHIYGYD